MNSNHKPRTHAERNRFPMRVDLTAADCRAERFSGIRQVSFDQSVEIWIRGTVQAVITKAQLDINPNAVEDAFAKITGVD